MHSEKFASDLHFGSRIGQDVKILCGDHQIYSGKWQPGFHDLIISYAYQQEQNITVLRARDSKMLFRIQPKSIWEDDENDR